MCPSIVINFKIPKEVWSGKPANYSRLRVFGYTAYSHQNDGKLVPWSIKCVFLDYL